MTWWRNIVRALERIWRRRGPAPLRVSPLGIAIRAGTSWTQGAMPQHGTRADQWWAGLMRDLHDAGLDTALADAQNIRPPLTIILDPVVDDRGYIDSSRPGVTVGGWYSPSRREIHVPGDYPWTARPDPQQPLKHEMTHHWARQALGIDAVSGDPTTAEAHHWMMPNGENIWTLQWQREEAT